MTLAFDDSGAAGAAVVCLPWFGASRVMTAEAFDPAFSGTGARMLYPDLPGHGDSPALATATSDAVLDSVVVFIDQCADGPVLLAGCSYGAYLAAAVGRRRPDLIRGMLLVCGGVRRTRDLPKLPARPAEVGWLDAVPVDLRGHMDAAVGTRTRSVATAVAAALNSGGPGDDAFLDALRGDGYFFADEDELSAFQGPAAVLAGRQDGIVGFADQCRQASGLPRGTFLAADLAGHYLPYERPQLLRSIALDLLERCSGAPPSAA